MNVYHVTGRIEYCLDHVCGECGEIHTAEKETYVRETVEAESAEQAKDKALRFILDRDYAKVSGLIQYFQWEKDQPHIEFVREVSEAEKMRRDGAPMLEGFA